MRSAALLAAAICLAAVGCVPSGGARQSAETSRLAIESKGGVHHFTVELADSPEERSIGLMHRTELGRDAGMLFDFGLPPAPQSMWMKNTLIPLDMAFIDADGTIIRIEAMTTPQSLTSVPSGGAVRAVLEVNGGRLAEIGATEGDRIRHPLFEGR